MFKIECMEIFEEIEALKSSLGKRVIVLGHHYQREEIIALSDVVGDSYYLAEYSSRAQAEYIVFCGVRFMAEAAAVLCRDDQKVLHPDRDAGCPLADMAELEDVEHAWRAIEDIACKDRTIPVTYINSDAKLKAFCGENGGLVCTSSNAKRALSSALDMAQKVFFFPDQHLGRNTAIDMGIADEEIYLWNSGGDIEESEEKIKRARVILWPGFCHVHTLFSRADVERVRREREGIKVVVHPECPREVVEASDAYGSTGFIVNYVKGSKPGTSIAVGTEINLVSRLAKENPDKRVIELRRSLCPNMFRITPQKLLHTLKNIESFGGVIVPDDVKRNARLALKRMLEV